MASAGVFACSSAFCASLAACWAWFLASDAQFRYSQPPSEPFFTFMKQIVSMGLPGAGSANWMCLLPAACTPNVRPSVHAAMSTSPLVSAVPGSALLVQNLVMYGFISRSRLMTGDGSLRLPPSSRLISHVMASPSVAVRCG